MEKVESSSLFIRSLWKAPETGLSSVAVESGGEEAHGRPPPAELGQLRMGGHECRPVLRVDFERVR